MAHKEKIVLDGLRFYGYHGVLPEEKTLGQWFEVDVEIEGNFSGAFATDRLEDTLNYAQVYEIVKSVVEGPGVNLIERLAGLIVEKIRLLPAVRGILVRVKKPQAPLGGPLDYAAAEMVWSADE